MDQTKLESLLESIINIGSGFFISFLLWVYVVAPLWGFNVSFIENITITSIFTVVSVIRSYVWRRFFNAGLHKWCKHVVATAWAR